MPSTSSKSITEKLVKDDASSDKGSEKELQGDGNPVGGFLRQILLSIIHHEAWIRSFRKMQTRMMTKASSAAFR